VGAAVGGIVDWVRHEHRQHWEAWNPLEEHHLRAVRAAAPQAPDDAIQRVAAVAGSRPPRAALRLKSYLEYNGPHRALGDMFWKSATTGVLTTALQYAYNSDRLARQSLGPIRVTGFYGPKTAAALTLYTHKSISPDPTPEAEAS
jgi:hypothetical protein